MNADTTTDAKPVCNAISKAKLLELLPESRTLTLVYTSFQGACSLHRTVKVASKYQLILTVMDAGPKLGHPSYLKFEAGDEFFVHGDNQGFSILSVGGGGVSYVFGHLLK